MPSPADPIIRPSQKLSDRGLALVVAGVFFALCLFNVWHHVMWRDEIRTWQVCAASPTWAALRDNMRYEGVPILWYAIVWVLTRYSNDPFAMQCMHTCLATVVVWFFARHAPFGRAIKILFPFGYFPFFEYAAISRNYALIFIGVLVATHLIAQSKDRPIALAVVLGLMAQVSIWGAAFAGLFLAAAAVRRIGSKDVSLAGPLRWIVAACLVSIAVGSCYVQIVPGPGASLIGGWKDEISPVDRVLRTFATAWKGFVPLPRIQRHFWNSNILDGQLILQASLGVCVLMLSVLLLLRRPTALILFALGAVGLLTFTHFQFSGATRHYGQLFMVFLSACWIAAADARSGVRSGVRTRRIGPAALWLDLRRERILTGLLALHVVGGVGANALGVVMPFSAAKVAADYVRTHVDAATPLVGYPDFCIAPLSAYLRRPFYFPEMLKVESYNTQDDQARITIDNRTALAEAAAVSKREGREVLLVVMALRSLDDQAPVAKIEIIRGAPPELFSVKILPRFTDSTVGDEVYSLYLIRPVDPPP